VPEDAKERSMDEVVKELHEKYMQALQVSMNPMWICVCVYL
jgi:hypothetical protein